MRWRQDPDAIVIIALPVSAGALVAGGGKPTTRCNGCAKERARWCPRTVGVTIPKPMGTSALLLLVAAVQIAAKPKPAPKGANVRVPRDDAAEE
jgi:hypothetical protein